MLFLDNNKEQRAFVNQNPLKANTHRKYSVAHEMSYH